MVSGLVLMHGAADLTLPAPLFRSAGMRAARRAAIQAASAAPGAWGLVLGTLGRQGSPAVLRRLKEALAARGTPHVCILLSEVTPPKLAAMSQGA